MKVSYPPRNMLTAGIVRSPMWWADSPGWSFWFVPGHADPITVAGATNLDGLSGFGWVATSLAVTEGSGADFLSSADLDPTRIITNGASDLLASPRIFGSYDHGLQAAEFLGYEPTKLILDLYGRFATASANETTSFMGMAGPAVVDAAAAASGGAFTSNGTNFIWVSDGATDTGALIDTSFHRWKAVYTFGSTVEWFIDGASQGTAAIEADIWPLSFVMFAGTTNRPELVWLNIRYG